MPNKYQQTHVTGEQWLRAKRIVIENPLEGLPTAKFVEESVVNIAGGEQFRRDSGVLEVPATRESMGNEIALVNPETGEPTGESVSYAQAVAVLHSAYLHFADKRDNPAPPSSDEPTEEEGAEEPTDG